MTADLPFTMSKHAIDRALEMGVTGEEIRACFDHPADITWSTKYRAWCYIRDRITLSITEDGTTVMTVLWSTEHAWHIDYARGGDMNGRERRSSKNMQHLPRR
ncbi:hypothetical protein [Curtobacterium sp. MCLR17_034]|uniref:hypothetical protein n=1 Tax=Curtobacterium sp. MCLR17_034 TaxID=2175623 RepID=UPI000DA72753|nr:hypothetical protein [Curtobacterium sp. MCLR17_034]PZF11743.1 hypothetical protein DEI98_06385 [Curtobacterium sp. MCLR17_034]